MWIAVILNCVIGLLYSRITVIRNVRVDGAPEWDRERLTKVLTSMKGQPCAQINAYHIESLCLLDPEVRTARLSRNLFGGALLKVGYRQAVAQIQGKSDWGLAVDGIVFKSDHLPPNLPIVDLGGSSANPLFTLAGSTPVEAIAEVVLKAKEIAPKSSIKVEINPGSVVGLTIDQGRIILGSSENLDAKLRVVGERLSSNPNYFSKVDTLNVTVPTSPTELMRAPGGNL